MKISAATPITTPETHGHARYRVRRKCMQRMYTTSLHVDHTVYGYALTGYLCGDTIAFLGVEAQFLEGKVLAVLTLIEVLDVVHVFHFAHAEKFLPYDVTRIIAIRTQFEELLTAWRLGPLKELEQTLQGRAEKGNLTD